MWEQLEVLEHHASAAPDGEHRVARGLVLPAEFKPLVARLERASHRPARAKQADQGGGERQRQAEVKAAACRRAINRMERIDFMRMCSVGIGMENQLPARLAAPAEWADCSKRPPFPQSIKFSKNMRIGGKPPGRGFESIRRDGAARHYNTA